jgi:arsenate reductase (thioredoxin)
MHRQFLPQPDGRRLGKHSEDPKMKTKILFLCTEFLPQPDGIEAYSAGIEKHGLNPLAVQVMAEAGVDIARAASKTVDELPVREFDIVITLCGHANETCPFFPGKKVPCRGFDDPPQLAAKAAKTEEEALAHYRRVRDEIRDFIQTLPEALDEGGSEKEPA